MLAPLSSNSLMMSQCPWRHATWRAVWPPTRSSICAERKNANPWSCQIFLNAPKFKFDSKSWIDITFIFPWSFKKYPSCYHCLLKPKLHGSHLIIIFLILLWFKKKVKGMKEKRYPFWVNIQDFLESWEVITSCSIHEVDVRLLMNDWACQTSHSVVVTERQLIVLGSSSL